MEMKNIITFTILVLIAFGCNWKKYKGGLNDDSRLNVDTSLIAIIPYDTSSIKWVFKNSQPAKLTNRDLITIDSLLKVCIEKHNLEQEIKFKEFNTKNPNNNMLKSNFTIDLKKYRRQYIAAIDIKSEKQVWVNCFCDEWDTNSRKYPKIVMDGGNCYFNLKINLTTKNYYSLIANEDF